MNSFTQEDLVQYMYGESSKYKKAALEAALDTDLDLKQQYEILLAGQQNLEPLKFSPRKNAVDFIMNYAEKSVTKQSTEV